MAAYVTLVFPSPGSKKSPAELRSRRNLTAFSWYLWGRHFSGALVPADNRDAAARCADEIEGALDAVGGFNFVAIGLPSFVQKSLELRRDFAGAFELDEEGAPTRDEKQAVRGSAATSQLHVLDADLHLRAGAGSGLDDGF